MHKGETINGKETCSGGCSSATSILAGNALASHASELGVGPPSLGAAQSAVRTDFLEGLALARRPAYLVPVGLTAGQVMRAWWNPATPPED